MAVKTVSSTNLSPNVAGALCYVPVIGWVAAIVLLIVEKNTTVKWNAVQALIVSGVNLVVWLVPFLWVIAWLVNLVVFVLQLVLAVKTYKGETVKLPLVGDWTDKILKKV